MRQADPSPSPTAYAQGWARNIKAAEAVKRILTDPHSPTKFRGAPSLSLPLHPFTNDSDDDDAGSDRAAVEQRGVLRGVRMQGWTAHVERQEVLGEFGIRPVAVRGSELTGCRPVSQVW